jgi:hypothetical protein
MDTEVSSLRRLFLLIALLALVLNGPVPASAAGRPRPAAAACDRDTCAGRACADSDEDRAEVWSLNPIQAQNCAAGSRRCHPGRPGTVPVVAVPRLAALEPGSAGGATFGPEPAPWPMALAQAVPWTGPAAGDGDVASHTSLPEAFPGVLVRTCVLRI